MKRPRYSDDQVLRILREHRDGQSVTALCRKYRISDTTFYKWRARRCGSDPALDEAPGRPFGKAKRL
ncbi:transposase [Roseibium sp.]|uniref:transposase n=1 Tax=Roseibium sp. TaxID=1936156 RepID=UPI003D0D9862